MECKTLRVRPLKNDPHALDSCHRPSRVPASAKSRMRITIRKRMKSTIKIQRSATRLKTSPDRAGSYRNCRRELRLPIPDLALCRVVVE